jgi:hypothetical protein
MLTEDQVVSAVCRDLRTRGYEIVTRATTKQRGIDIAATSGTQSLVVEAKGATSNRPSSNRFGKPFTKRQCCTHVGVAFFTAAALMNERTRGIKRRVAIALPANKHHQEYVDRIARPLRALGIAVIWVDSRRRVTYSATWKI